MALTSMNPACGNDHNIESFSRLTCPPPALFLSHCFPLPFPPSPNQAGREADGRRPCDHASAQTHSPSHSLPFQPYPFPPYSLLILPRQAVKLMVKVLAKSMDSSLAVDKVELATVTRDEASGKVSGCSSTTCMVDMWCKHWSNIWSNIGQTLACIERDNRQGERSQQRAAAWWAFGQPSVKHL